MGTLTHVNQFGWDGKRGGGGGWYIHVLGGGGGAQFRCSILKLIYVCIHTHNVFTLSEVGGSLKK